MRGCHGCRPRDVAKVKLHENAALPGAEAVDAQHHRRGIASVDGRVGINFDIFDHWKKAGGVKDGPAGEIHRVVSSSVIRSLIFWISILVDGRPHTDTVALVGSYTPVNPLVAFAVVLNAQRQVGGVKGEVFMLTSDQIVGSKTLGIVNHSTVGGSTRHPSGLVRIGCRPVEIGLILAGGTRHGGVPKRRTVDGVEVRWRGYNPCCVEGIGHVETRAHAHG